MSGWHEATLGELVDMSSGKPIKPGQEGLFPAFGSNGVIGKSPTARHQAGIIVGRAGSAGSIAVSHEPFWASDNTIVLEPIDSNDLDFLYYLLRNTNLARYVGGSAQPLLTQTTLKRLTFLVPLPAQRSKIGEVLKAFDELITIERRRIAVLEQIAQAIYREWFVQFRYPGHEDDELVESPLGLIPAEWRVVSVGALVERLRPGARYTPSEVGGSGCVPVIDQSRATLLGFHNDQPGIQASVDRPVLVFGDHTCRMAVMTTPFSVGPNVIPFRPSDNLPALTLYRLIESLVETREYKRHWNDLMKKETLTPSDACALQYSELSEPIDQTQKVLEATNRELARIRDWLLPKLVTGAIDVSDLDLDALVEEPAA